MVDGLRKCAGEQAPQDDDYCLIPHLHGSMYFTDARSSTFAWIDQRKEGECVCVAMLGTTSKKQGVFSLFFLVNSHNL